jgi:hypothetical protein
VFLEELMMSLFFHAIGSLLQEADMVDTGDQSEDAEIEDDREASDTDQEHDVGVNDHSSAEGLEFVRFVFIKSSTFKTN